MKKLTQKLVLSVITMALVVVALGTSTFAWFTLTNTATVSAFSGQITAGEGIEVTLGTRTVDGETVTWAVDGNTIWYTVLPVAVINQYILDTRTANFRFSDLTSQNGTTFNKLNWADSTFSDGTGYISLPITFRSRAQQDIVWNSVTLGGSTVLWTANVGSFLHNGSVTIGSNTATTQKTLRVAASSAARVSIDGVVSTKSADTTPVFTPVAVHKAVVYQLPANAGSETVAFNSTESLAAYNFTLDEVVDSPTNGKYIIGPAAYGAGSYTLAAGKTLAFTAAQYGTLGAGIAPVTPVTAVDNNTVVLTLETLTGGYYQSQLTVRVWIEGWDADTFDALFNTNLSVQLGFTTKPTVVA